jgi:hypothetical protein
VLSRSTRSFFQISNVLCVILKFSLISELPLDGSDDGSNGPGNHQLSGGKNTEKVGAWVAKLEGEGWLSWREKGG